MFRVSKDSGIELTHNREEMIVHDGNDYFELPQLITPRRNPNLVIVGDFLFAMFGQICDSKTKNVDLCEDCECLNLPKLMESIYKKTEPPKWRKVCKSDISVDGVSFLNPCLLKIDNEGTFAVFGGKFCKTLKGGFTLDMANKKCYTLKINQSEF